MQADKRDLTIMFCDILGSTSLAEKLPLDDFAEVIGAYHKCVYRAITSHYGFIAQYLGDGVMSYFGYPTSFDASPVHAIKAGLSCLKDIQDVKHETRDTYQVELNIRISIHTGTVVMVDLGLGNRKERLALGEAPNIAARLQGISPENGIAVSKETYERTKSHFTFVKLGSHIFKGLTDPIDVYRPVKVL